MGLFRLLQPGGAEAPAGGDGHAAAPQGRRPLPAPSQTAQDGGGRPRPGQRQDQSCPGCRGQGDDHQGEHCESGAGDGDWEGPPCAQLFLPGRGTAELTQSPPTLSSRNLSPSPRAGW